MMLFLNLGFCCSDFTIKSYALIHWENYDKNPITNIFRGQTKGRFNDEGQFYHFNDLNIALGIISKKEIQVSNIISNLPDDYAEFIEFYKRTNLLGKFEGEGNGVDTYESKIEKEKDRSLILCFTKSWRNERFWKDYANDDTGVCISFRFKMFCRDVVYDKGYTFDYLNTIDYHFKREFGKRLFLSGVTKFSRFYKRGKYSWENETRLLSNYDAFSKELQESFELKKGENRKYIVLSLEGNEKPNPFFTLTIDEVICGKFVDDDSYNQLKCDRKSNFPEANIWKPS